MQPKQIDFDLAAATEAVVQVRASVPEKAFTASILGTERVGSGVVIDNGSLVLTIGYLVTEAESIWLTTSSGKAVAATVLAYDFATGFGLLLPLGRLGLPSLETGRSVDSAIGDDVYFISHGGLEHSLSAGIASKREFAGYWEYVLDEAIFTTPAHPEWGGAALLNRSGKLIGIGSLLVDDATLGKAVQGNMVVPIDLLTPILPELIAKGRGPQSARPWLGMYTAANDGKFVVVGVAPGGPAEQAGIRTGDVVVDISGSRPHRLPDFFRKIWGHGNAGVEIPLTLSRDGNLIDTRVRSADRNQYLYKPALH